MRWTPAIDAVFVVCVAALFVYAVIGLVLTGPVVVRPPRLTLETVVSADRLRADVNRLTADFGPRDFRHGEDLGLAAAWIADELRAAGLEVEERPYQLREGRFVNVVARRPGADPSRGAIVVGAHYDTVRGSPGANDNASGVAALLELARTLPAEPSATTQYFVAFATAEPPFFGSDDMGSARFARSLVDAGVTVELMVSLDSVGYYSDARNTQSYPWSALGIFYPERGNFLAVVGDMQSGDALRTAKTGLSMPRGVDLKIESIRWPGAARIMLSDHLSFRRLDLPAVLVTDTGYLRDPAFHARGDTPERLDYERLADVVRAMHGVLWIPVRD